MSKIKCLEPFMVYDCEADEIIGFAETKEEIIAITQSHIEEKGTALVNIELWQRANEVFKIEKIVLEETTNAK